MKMDGNIRVRTERRHSRLYNDLSGVAVNENHDLFYIAASIAYSRSVRKPLEKGTDKFWSRTIRPDEWCTYYAMVLEDNDMDFSTIRDDTAVIRHVEEYANAGIDILTSDWLANFVQNHDGELAIDKTSAAELPKLLFYNVLEAASSYRD
jgi:hypothetical protein